MGGAIHVTADEARELFITTPGCQSSTGSIKATGGVCSLLKAGMCSRYESRPGGCKEYPWYNVGGRLFVDIGCPGIKYDKDGRPNVSEIRSIDTYLPSRSIFRKLILALLRVW